MSFLGKIFGTGDIMGSVERLASEFIETDMESAEAKTLMIKTLDPNGLMRRDLAKTTSQMYKFYLMTTVGLITLHFFGYGGTVEIMIEGTLTEVSSTGSAIEALTSLFAPITGAWGVILSASFGVNYANVKAGN